MVIAAESGFLLVEPLPVDLVAIFRESRSQVLATAFSRFISKQNPALQSIGLRGSLLTGDPASILAIRQNYNALSTSEAWGPLVDEIRIYYTNTGAQAIQTLGLITSDSSVGTDLRIAAAGALARMHTKWTLPYLAKLLDDPSSALRAMGVGGLSSFANNVPIGEHEPAPGVWRYRTDDTIAHSVFDEALIDQRQAFYVGFWKDWWIQNQGHLL